MITMVNEFLKTRKNEKIVRNAINTFLQNNNKTGLSCGIREYKWSLFLKQKIHRNYHQLTTQIAWELGVISFTWERFKRSPEYLQLAYH